MPSISVPSVKGETHLGFSISRNLAKIYEANYNFMCVGILVRFIGWSAGKGEQSQVATIQLISSALFVQNKKVHSCWCATKIFQICKAELGHCPAFVHFIVEKVVTCCFWEFHDKNPPLFFTTSQSIPRLPC